MDCLFIYFGNCSKHCSNNNLGSYLRKKTLLPFSGKYIFLILINYCFWMLVLVPGHKCEEQISQTYALYLGNQTSWTTVPSLSCLPLFLQTHDRTLNGSMQKGNRDGMCYSYALNITKYSTTVVSCLHSFMKTHLKSLSFQIL